jgi:hypothetical protein
MAAIVADDAYDPQKFCPATIRTDIVVRSFASAFVLGTLQHAAPQELESRDRDRRATSLLISAEGAAVGCEDHPINSTSRG